MDTVIIAKGWLVEVSDDGQYLYVYITGKPGYAAIKREDEGVVVDIFSTPPADDSVASTYAHYTELGEKI